jgi:protein-disulfide isomerase
MKSRFSLILIAAVVIFGGLLVFNKKDEKPSTNAQPSNHLRGDTSSKVTFVEYGDFQCPACEAYYPLVEQAYDKYKDKVSFQFRSFPITSAHPHAVAAHRAAEAADKQGKYWEMYHKLYDNQPTWSPQGTSLPDAQVSSMFEQYAKEIGLNIDQYNADRQSSAVNDIIQADAKEGSKLGVTGTPTFFINGKKHETSEIRDQDGLNKLIEAALAETK